MLPVIVSKVYMYRYMRYVCIKVYICMCGTVTISTLSEGMHMQTRVKCFKIEKKAIFDVRDGKNV